MRWSPEQLAHDAGGRLIRAGSQAIEGAFIDTRTPLERGLFVPLVAARDGHEFIPQALSGGASAVLVHPGHTVDGDVTVVEVDDTLLALQALGREARRAWQGPVVAVTGSNGKTTTRAMIRAVLKSGFSPVLGTRGNFNNHLGVPLTLLGEPHAPAAAVVEMGMSAPGENRLLGTIVAPTQLVVTSVALEHLEFMGSIEAIADAELEPAAAMGSGTTLFVPGDEALLRERIPAGFAGQVVEFAAGAGARARVRTTRAGDTGTWAEFEIDGEAHALQLQLFGDHNARNAAAAIAVGLELGLEVQGMLAALADVTPVGDRGRVERVGPHRAILDCYNANPGSMEAALGTLGGVEGRRVAVLGDMLELGPTEHALHEEVGRRVAAAGVDVLVTVGALARAIAATAKAAHSASFDRGEQGAAAAWLADALEDGPPATVLFKGSRGIALEQVADAWRAAVTGVAAGRP